MSSKLVQVYTEYGIIEGIRKKSFLDTDYISFQGIPYIKAPVGELRFAAPQEIEPFGKIFDATVEGQKFCCIDFISLKVEGEEDAIHLNIFTKDVSPETPYPVIVFIGGVGFVNGSSSTEIFGPDYILQKDVILVTLNYRLGVFGFLSLDERELNVPGNNGLQDQLFALRWIQKSIAKFGGDPGNVTLMGHSAGAASVHYHCISNASRGLFHKAIIMSGSAFSKCWTLIPRKNWARRLVALLGGDENASGEEILNFLRSFTAMELVKKQESILTDEERFEESILYSFGPCIEPYETSKSFIHTDPVIMARNAWGNEIDIIIGGTSKEAIAFIPVLNYAPDFMTDSYELLVPPELGLPLDSPQREKIGAELQELYYNFVPPSFSNLVGFLNLTSDRFFWHGMHRAVLSRMNSVSNSKTYLYRFDLISKQNHFKRLFTGKFKKFKGASHFDDIAYLFKGSLFPDPEIFSHEMEMIEMMVELFTSFAISNIPKYNDITWNEVLNRDPPFQCLHISENVSMMEFPEAFRMVIWDSFYESHVPLY